MTIREKLLNLLLKPFGLSVITREDWEKGRADTEAMDRLAETVNPKCKHGSRVRWCDKCEEMGS